MTSSADAPTALLNFEALDARIRSAVESVAATDPNPADPFRGLYISDDLAVELASRRAGRRAGRPDRARRAAVRAERARDGGARALRRAGARLALRPALRLPARRRDPEAAEPAADRRACSPSRAISAAQALDCFDHAAPLRRTGAVRLLEPGSQLPLADRLLKLSDRLAAYLLGSGLDEPLRDGRLRPVAAPRARPGAPGDDRRAAARCSPPTAALPDPGRRPRRAGAPRGGARAAAPARRRRRRDATSS